MESFHSPHPPPPQEENDFEDGERDDMKHSKFSLLVLAK
jgi:hypothetical protein